MLFRNFKSFADSKVHIYILFDDTVMTQNFQHRARCCGDCHHSFKSGGDHTPPSQYKAMLTATNTTHTNPTTATTTTTTTLPLLPLLLLLLPPLLHCHYYCCCYHHYYFITTNTITAAASLLSALPPLLIYYWPNNSLSLCCREKTARRPRDSDSVADDEPWKSSAASGRQKNQGRARGKETFRTSSGNHASNHCYLIVSRVSSCDIIRKISKPSLLKYVWSKKAGAREV